MLKIIALGILSSFIKDSFINNSFLPMLPSNLERERKLDMTEYQALRMTNLVQFLIMLVLTF